MNRYYCSYCDKHTSHVKAQATLEVEILMWETDEWDITRSNGVTWISRDEVDMKSLRCMKCDGLLEIRSGHWEFVDDEQAGGKKSNA